LVDQFSAREVEAVAAPGKSIAASTEKQAARWTVRFMQAAYRPDRAEETLLKRPSLSN
jgi:hypothetical protein